jgi:hypothetical protein
MGWFGFPTALSPTSSDLIGSHSECLDEVYLLFVTGVTLGLENPGLWIEYHPSLDGWVRQ